MTLRAGIVITTPMLGAFTYFDPGGFMIAATIGVSLFAALIWSLSVASAWSEIREALPVDRGSR